MVVATRTVSSEVGEGAESLEAFDITAFNEKSVHSFYFSDRRCLLIVSDKLNR